MYEILVLSLALSWLFIGVGLSWFMGRRGHLAFGWFVFGTLTGPMAVALAATVRRRPKGGLVKEVRMPATARGDVDVLVGVDGSASSFAAVDAAVALVGPRIGRVTFATVLPYEAGREDERRAAALLEDLGRRSGRQGVGLELLHGNPARALVEFAAGDGYELVVVGKRGRGVANRLLGSTAAELARNPEVPVLLLGD